MLMYINTIYGLEDMPQRVYLLQGLRRSVCHLLTLRRQPKHRDLNFLYLIFHLLNPVSIPRKHLHHISHPFTSKGFYYCIPFLHMFEEPWEGSCLSSTTYTLIRLGSFILFKSQKYSVYLNDLNRLPL